MLDFCLSKLSNLLLIISEILIPPEVLLSADTETYNTSISPVVTSLAKLSSVLEVSRVIYNLDLKSG